MRLTLTEEEVVVIISSLLLSRRENVLLIKKLLEQRQQSSKISNKKRNATKKAHKARSDMTKKKIQNAINLLRLEGEKITKKAIKEKAEVHYESIRKYVDISVFDK